MQATAWYSFNAREHEGDELSFKKNDVLKILHKAEAEGYYKAELNGKVGTVPANHLDFFPPIWYMEIGKEEAFELLQEKDTTGSDVQPNGAFIVRPSSRNPGEIKLTVKLSSGVKNMTIRTTGDGEGGKFVYFVWDAKKKERFQSINELVKYYRSHSIRNTCDERLKDIKVVTKKAKYDYRARSDTELSFNKGDDLLVLSSTNPTWHLCEMIVRDCYGKRPVRGRVQANYM